MKRLSDRVVPSKYHNRVSGQITVFFSLLLAVFFSLLSTVIESAREQMVQVETMNVGYIGMNSVLAEYQKDLLEDYQLFFLDAGYGRGELTEGKLNGRLHNYLLQNLELPERKSYLPGTDFLQIRPEQVSCGEFVLMTDNGGAVFYRQAVEAAKSTSGFTLIADIVSRITGWNQEVDIEGTESRITEQEREVDGQLAGLEEDKKRVIEEQGVDPPNLENPMDTVKELKKLSSLQLVLEHPEQISRQLVNPETLPSVRRLHTGTGTQNENGKDLLSDVIFDEYLLSHFTDYTTASEQEQGLRYQIEYLLGGKESDTANLEFVVNRLLLIREGFNFVSMCQDSSKQAEATALATALVGFTGLPPLVEATKTGILLAWAFQESVENVKALLNGEKVPLIYGESAFQQNTGEGLSYQDYLRMLLLLENRQKKVMRAIDLIELHIRVNKQQPAFRIDACVESMQIHLEFTAPRIFFRLFPVYGTGSMQEIVIDRRYGYD